MGGRKEKERLSKGKEKQVKDKAGAKKAGAKKAGVKKSSAKKSSAKTSGAKAPAKAAKKPAKAASSKAPAKGREPAAKKTAPATEYRTWLRQPYVACVFARYLSRNHEKHGIRTETLGGDDPTSIAADLAARVDRLVNDQDASAATLIFPTATTLADLVHVALALRSHMSWSVTRTVIHGTPIGDAVAFGLVREIPFNGSLCPSEALVLGPHPEFPATRRSPVTVLEIFVGVPPEYNNHGKPTMKANLDLINLEGMPGHTSFQRMWENSEKARASLVGDDPRAKAKVSFVIPMELANSLGCAP